MYHSCVRGASYPRYNGIVSPSKPDRAFEPQSQSVWYLRLNINNCLASSTKLTWLKRCGLSASRWLWHVAVAAAAATVATEVGVSHLQLSVRFFPQRQRGDVLGAPYKPESTKTGRNGTKNGVQKVRCVSSVYCSMDPHPQPQPAPPTSKLQHDRR